MLESIRKNLEKKGVDSDEIDEILEGISAKLNNLDGPSAGTVSGGVGGKSGKSANTANTAEDLKALLQSHGLHEVSIQDIETLTERAEEDYFRYILSPDCQSCKGTVFDTVGNRNSVTNDDQYGDRTAYYMTGALFGCQVMF